MPLGPKKVAAATMATILLIAGACGQCGAPKTPAPPDTPSPDAATASPTSVPPPQQTPTPQPLDIVKLLEESGQVMSRLETFHFTLKHERGSIQLIPGLDIEEAEGDIVSPDKLEVKFTGVFGKGYAIKSGLITLGDSSYMLNPLTGEWEAAETGVSPLGFFNPRLGISSMMSKLQQPRQLEAVSGDRQVHRLAGSLPAEALGPLLGEALKDATVLIELSIDSKKSHLLEARVIGPVTPSDVQEVVRVLTVSNFNVPVTIERPE